MTQTDFTIALFDPERAAPADLRSFNGSDPAQRFAIYRNNVIVSLIEALAAKFPTVQALVGEEFFRAMARLFVAQVPPKSRLMAEYGDDLPRFIESFAPVAALPYLADVARLEAARVSAYHAADSTSRDAADFAALDQARLFETGIISHPSARLLSSAHAIFSLWAAHQGQGDIASVEPDQAESVLVCRPALDVEVTLLPSGADAFLTALQAQKTIGEAAQIAFDAHPQFDLAAAFQILLTSGFAADIIPPPL